jgi:hypothetical protein
MTEHSVKIDNDTYELRIGGHLDARWAVTLGVSKLSHQADGTTVLGCNAMDQPALHGLLQRIRDLGLPLISVARIEPEHST